MYHYPIVSYLCTWTTILSVLLSVWFPVATSNAAPSNEPQVSAPQSVENPYNHEQVFSGENVHPLLHQVADEAPDETVRVIIQKSGHGDEAESSVRANGGTILHNFTIINAFTALLPANNVLKLSGNPAIRWVSLDAPVEKSAEPRQENGNQLVYDTFKTATYGGSDGTDSWSEPWSEVGEMDGASLGNVVVTRFFGGEQQGLRLQGATQGAQRFVNLTDHANATLSFSYRRKDLTDVNHYVSVEASKNDGQTWTEIGRIAGPATDTIIATASFDISPFSSTSTGIRFLTSAAMGTEHRVYIDNVQIEFQPQTVDEVTHNEFTLYLPQIMSGGNGIPLQTQVADSETAADAPLLITNRRVAVDTRSQAVDNFHARSYKWDNGSVDWASKWQEFGETQNEFYGLIKVVSSRNCTSGYCLRMGARLSHDYSVDSFAIVREVDLSNAANAELSFDYQRRAQWHGSTSVNAEISTDNGRTWSVLEEYKLDSNDNKAQKAVIDISNHISYQTLIRFRLVGTIPRYTTKFLYIDNVKVAYEEGDNPQDPNGSGGDDSPPTNGSVKDTFTFDGYGNNDGTIEWLDRWTEINDEGSPDRGDIWVWQYELSMRNSNRGVERTFNFAGSGEATLSFDYQRYSFDTSDDYATVALSSDGGSTWTEVYRLQGPATDRRYETKKIDISDYVSQETKIRFLTSPSLSNRDYLYLDNISISYNCAECVDTSSLASQHVKSLEAHTLWNGSKSLQGQGITVAVVDSGIANHPDLLDQNGVSRVLANVDFTGTTGFSDDYYGHGTHVAGLIAGNGHHSKGAYMGVAPKANLVDVRVIDDFGVGYMSNVVAGLEWILLNKDRYNIRVANLSLNSSVPESYHVSPLNAAIEILWFNKITVVVSAGNNGSDGILYPPANDPFVITIGATDTKGTDSIDDDEVASFSAQGETQEGINKPELVVAGKGLIGPLASDDSNLVLSYPSHLVPGVNGNNYFNMSGTSMASAVASGAIVQLIQNEPHLTPDQIKHRLIDTAKVKDGNNYLRIVQAVHGKSTERANVGLKISNLLFTGPNILNLEKSWSSVAWGSVAWGSVAWGSLTWGSVAWGSVNWDLDNLDASDEVDEIVDTDDLQ